MGNNVPVEEVVKEALKDKSFFEKSGGWKIEWRDYRARKIAATGLEAQSQGLLGP